MIKKIIAILIAGLATYVAAVVLLSQLNISQVTSLGFAVSLSQRFAAVLHDLQGMLTIYLPLILVALLIAFLFTSLLLLRFVYKPAFLFPLAGFVAIVSIHVILNIVFGVAGIAPTRTMVGLISQGLAGAMGGYIYFKMAHTRRTTNWDR